MFVETKIIFPLIVKDFNHLTYFNLKETLSLNLSLPVNSFTKRLG